MTRKVKGNKKVEAKLGNVERKSSQEMKGANVHPAPEKLPAQTALEKELADEQQNLTDDLDDYIAEFSSKCATMKHAVTEGDLIVFFVMNLHPRWKRLVEPLEPTFLTWEEAATAARYHALKLCAILGLERSDNVFFLSKESKQLLASGYFVPDNHPCKTRKTVSPVAFTDDSSTVIAPAILDSPNVSSALNGTNTPKTQPSTSQTSNASKPSTPLKATNASATSNSSNTQPALSTVSKPKSTKHKAAPAEISTYDLEKLAEVFNQSQTSICYYIPEEHHNKNLPFLELNISGHNVRALLAKRRWKVSAMSLALQQKLSLPLDPLTRFFVDTEFELVMESVGTAMASISHPADNKLKQTVPIQVLPEIYGGKLDLVLGADFFAVFGASFTDVDRHAIKFMNKETTFSVDVLT